VRQFSTDQLNHWLANHEPPCISLYQPTHRKHPDNAQDPIRFRNMLRSIEASLKDAYPGTDVDARMEPFLALAQDLEFWKHRTEGLAILSSPSSFDVIDLQRPVTELLVVADTFHTKPLLRVVQSADRYQILLLSRHEAKLFEGNRDALDQVALTNVPATITDALGEELTDAHHNTAAYGGNAGGATGHTGGGMHHGAGAKKDEVEVDMYRFFRVIDRAILEHHSRPSGLPLMLAALPEHHAPFREVSHNPFLMAEGIAMNADALDMEQLRVAAWEHAEPMYVARLAALVDEYQSAHAHARGSDDLWQVAEAAVAGRVATLLVEADRVIPGRMDDTGRVELATDIAPTIDDLLDDVAEEVLRRKGEVIVVPAARMPSRSGLAAAYRY
jgi:hypothetical protein